MLQKNHIRDHDTVLNDLRPVESEGAIGEGGSEQISMNKKATLFMLFRSPPSIC